MMDTERSFSFAIASIVSFSSRVSLTWIACSFSFAFDRAMGTPMCTYVLHYFRHGCKERISLCPFSLGGEVQHAGDPDSSSLVVADHDDRDRLGNEAHETPHDSVRVHPGAVLL